MKNLAIIGGFILIVWGGVVGLTAVLDHYGFGPNTQTQRDRIETNLRKLEDQNNTKNTPIAP